MSQLALVLESPTSLTIKSHPIPEPGKGHVLVRIEAAAFNPADYKIFDARWPLVYPTVLGLDAAGEVIKVGPDVTKFKVGDRVTFGCLPSADGAGARGAFQQYALADVVRTTKVPSNSDYDAASTFPSGADTAGEVYDTLKLTAPWLGGEGAYKGEKFVILGGSSSVGSYAIQLAVLSGFEVTTTCSPAHFAYVKSLGATTVIDRSAPDVATQILAATGGPVKYALDTVSLEPTQLLALDVVQPQGTLVLILGALPAVQSAADAKGVVVAYRFGMEGRHFDGRFWDAVPGYVERGVLKFNRPTVLSGGLKAWEEGFRLHREGKVSGTKLVIRPQETE